MSHFSLFLPYQKRWIHDVSRLKIMEKSRQIGLSWCSAYSLVRKHLDTSYRWDSWVSSRDETQAKLFLRDCRLFASLFDPTDGSKDRRHSATSLAFPNGTTIHSLSSNPDAQAGKRGHRLLDEFALHPDPKCLYSIALPGITWGGQLEIISTHRGSFNFFNQLIQEARQEGNPKGFSLHRVTLQDALDEGFLKKLKMKLGADDPRQDMDEAAYFDYIRASCPDEETFQQEYMCNPIDERTTFLSSALIAGCEYKERFNWQIELPYDNGHLGAQLRSDCFLGVDLGREEDRTVFWLLEVIDGVAFTRRVEVLYREPFRRQEEILMNFLRLPLLRRVCIDQTGIGQQFCERAKERFGSYLVEGVTFTAAMKEKMAYDLRTAFETQALRIPVDDTIRADFQSIRKEMTGAGNLRLGAKRGSSGHGDRFWALALALHARVPTAEFLSSSTPTFHFWKSSSSTILL